MCTVQVQTLTQYFYGTIISQLKFPGKRSVIVPLIFYRDRHSLASK